MSVGSEGDKLWGLHMWVLGARALANLSPYALTRSLWPIYASTSGYKSFHFCTSLHLLMFVNTTAMKQHHVVLLIFVLWNVREADCLFKGLTVDFLLNDLVFCAVRVSVGWHLLTALLWAEFWPCTNHMLTSNPGTSECDCLWRQGLQRGKLNQALIDRPVLL